MSDRQVNWAGNYEYKAARLHEPESVDELAEIVGSATKVKALGSRHSFNDIADTSLDLVSTKWLDRIVELNRAEGTVTIQGGVAYGPLCEYLDREGFALPNLASLPHISVAGACATATHGSGVRNGNLATAVRGVKLVVADGTTQEFRRGDPDFEGVVVGLGALGIAVELTLDVLPAFSMTQEVFEGLPLAHLDGRFDEVMGAGYSVSLFTDWKTDLINQVWIKRSLLEPRVEPDLGSAQPADGDRTPIPNGPVENCNPQMGVPGPWHQRMPHFKMDFTPSSGEELQSEFFVRRSDAVAALQAVDSMRDAISPLLFISEVRTIRADSLWLSPNFERDSVAIHFTWRPMTAEVLAVLPRLEAALAPFEARQHWGKLSTLPGSVIRSRYPRWADFRSLVERLDPAEKFRNAYWDRLLG
jgi:alditol oxidase